LEKGDCKGLVERKKTPLPMVRLALAIGAIIKTEH
jgi:hypothetical protein